MNVSKILMMSLLTFTILGTTCAGGVRKIEIQNKTLKVVIIDSLVNKEYQIKIAFNDTVKGLSEDNIYLRIDQTTMYSMRRSEFLLYYHYLNEESKVIKVHPKKYLRTSMRFKVIFRD